MRKIILGLAVSLDGFIEGPKGEYDWCFMDQDYGMSDFLKRVDTLFMGRKTYELTLTMKGNGGLPPMKEYVFSNTLKEVKKAAVLISGDIRQQVEKIRNSEGKDIWLFGGAALTSSLMNLGLIDEIWLALHPVILGSGKALFNGIGKRTWLRLTDTRVYSTGLVSMIYEVEKKGRKKNEGKTRNKVSADA
jgi:dihydrofolate reductase